MLRSCQGDALRPPTPTQLAGFTLFEVLFVLIIVGILSAITAPSWIAQPPTGNVANDAPVLRRYKAQQKPKDKTQLPASASCLFKTNPKLLSIQQDLCRARPDFQTNLGEDIALKPVSFTIHHWYTKPSVNVS